MQVRLKVIGGKNDGREIKIAVPEFVIGRGEDAHLKPTSDLISRRHCSIKIGDGKVIVADLGSRNGTFVNGEQLKGPIEAKVGDVLRVGRLQFEMLIDVAQPSIKRPPVEGVAEAAARTAARPSKTGNNLEDSISSWLTEDVDEAQRLQETTQLSLEDTKAIMAEAERKAVEKEKVRKQDSGMFSANLDESGSSIGESPKRPAGKLPPKPKFSHDSSKVAADDVLRKFFNRR